VQITQATLQAAEIFMFKVTNIEQKVGHLSQMPHRLFSFRNFFSSYCCFSFI